MLLRALPIAFGLSAFAAIAQTPAPRPATRPVVKPTASAAAEPRAVAIFAAEQIVALRAGADGRIASVGATEGMRVRKGAVVVQLDDREQRARVALAGRAAGSDADVRAADVRKREAEARLNGTQTAAKTGAATEWELRQASAFAQQATMESRAAQDRKGVEAQRLALEKVLLENYAIRAPFDGRVARLGARTGMSVRKSDVLATLVNLAMLRGEAFVPVARYGALKVGADYPVTFGAPFGRTLRARLVYIDPVIDGGQVHVVFQLANADEALPSGLQASITLKPLVK